jgi:hypothetical protein
MVQLLRNKPQAFVWLKSHQLPSVTLHLMGIELRGVKWNLLRPDKAEDTPVCTTSH